MVIPICQDPFQSRAQSRIASPIPSCYCDRDTRACQLPRTPRTS